MRRQPLPTGRTAAWGAALAALLALAFWTGPAQAHRLRPALATLSFTHDGVYRLDLTLNAEAALAGIGPEHEDTDDAPTADDYQALRALDAPALASRIHASADEILKGITIAFDGTPAPPPGLTGVAVPEDPDVSRERLTRLTLTGTRPVAAETVTWRYPRRLGASALRVVPASGPPLATDWLAAGETSAPIAIDGLASAPSTGEVATRYVTLGFTHIIPAGLDHVLFVLGIFLLSLRLRPLLYQVTAFTVAHSITLAMGLYGLVSVPESVVEPLIAASIVYVAVENLVTTRLQPWRVYVVFVFGLLHGLGFAGVLRDLGLPREEFVTALVAFNVGVELGQLAVIAAAFLAVGIWCRNREWYHRAVVVPASTVIALVGAYWTVSRIL